MSSEVKWIKIVTDIFDDEKIVLIESMPDADSIIVIWFKLLCLAGKSNNCGILTMNERIAYTDEMLAHVFRRPLNTIRLALKTFEQFGMIEIINDTIVIPNWGKHQSLDRMMEMKEYNRIKQRESRARKKALLAADDNVNDMSLTSQRSSISISYSNSHYTSDNNEEENTGLVDRGKEQKRSGKVFVKPTADEVDAYCKERNNGIKGTAFIDYYDSVGWVVGAARKPMKDWKAAVRQWERKEESGVTNSANNRGHYSGNTCPPRTVYDLKPHFAGESDDGNA